MQKYLLLIIASLLISYPSYADTKDGRDIIVTMKEVTVQPADGQSKEIKITLKNPVIHYKAQHGNNQSIAMTPAKLTSFWSSKSSSSDSFNKIPPNAILSYWTPDGQFSQTNFVIQKVEQTSSGLVMTANVIGGDAIDNNAVDKKTSIVMLIDNGPFDPR